MNLLTPYCLLYSLCLCVYSLCLLYCETITTLNHPFTMSFIYLCLFSLVRDHSWLYPGGQNQHFNSLINFIIFDYYFYSLLFIESSLRWSNFYPNSFFYGFHWTYSSLYLYNFLYYSHLFYAEAAPISWCSCRQVSSVSGASFLSKWYPHNIYVRLIHLILIILLIKLHTFDHSTGLPSFFHFLTLISP